MFLISLAILASAIPPAFSEATWNVTWDETMAQAAASSDPAAARRLYGEALRQVLENGPGTLRHARTLDDLAYLNLEEGAAGPAEALYLQSIPMFRKLLGPNQPRLAISLHNLGVLYLREGRDGEAETPIREALRIWTDSFGLQHPDTARACRSLSVLMRRQGQDAEADRLEELAAPLLREQEGEPAH